MHFHYGILSTVETIYITFLVDLISCTTPVCFSTFYRCAMVPTLAENSNFFVYLYTYSWRHSTQVQSQDQSEVSILSIAEVTPIYPCYVYQCSYNNYCKYRQKSIIEILYHILIGKVWCLNLVRKIVGKIVNFIIGGF